MTGTVVPCAGLVREQVSSVGARRTRARIFCKHRRKSRRNLAKSKQITLLAGGNRKSPFESHFSTRQITLSTPQITRSLTLFGGGDLVATPTLAWRAIRRDILSRGRNKVLSHILDILTSRFY